MLNDTHKITVALDTIGCKLNQAETENWAEQLAAAGYYLVSPTEKADVYVLNTCTVTHIADRKCRNWCRQAHRCNPDALIVAAGCYAERAAPDLNAIAGVDIILGNTAKKHLAEVLAEKLSLPRGSPVKSSGSAGDRTRAFVHIQDGCSNFCTYCIVPLVRGPEKSVPLEQIIAAIKSKIAAGYKEVVITGTEVGAYNYAGMNLKELLQRILSETGISRLRLSSLQPSEITPELVALWQDSRMCRHFHLALQSGSDSVLRRMGRHYTATDFQQAVSFLRGSIPDVSITTDIIVGFPGETEAEFIASHEFCRQMEFARIHVFPYSPRPGTAAARLHPRVSDKIKKERSRRMLALAADSTAKFRHQSTGKFLSVLWEKQSGGVWSGLTDNYLRVHLRSSEDLTNEIQMVKLDKSIYTDDHEELE